MSVTTAARELGTTRQTLHRIMAEEQPVTAEMAVRLGKWCGNGPDLWLALQRNRDVWDAAHSLESEVAKIPTRKPAAA